MHVRTEAKQRARGIEAAASQRLRVGIAVLVGLIVLGTVGFRWVGEMTWVDAIYMTVTTLATVGYGEPQPLGPGGRLFATGFILLGVGTALYTASALAEFLIAGRVGEWVERRAMDRTLGEMRGHVIVCGYGRLGRSVGRELERAGVPQVIVEEDPDVVARLGGAYHPVLTAGADDEGVLERAGVARARAIVAATGSEAVNVFIALGAREANPAIAIHARAETEAGARRLRQAGANQVVSPYQLGGQRLAQAILRPAAIDFLELSGAGSGIDLEEVSVGDGSALASLHVADLAAHGVRVAVVAIKRGSEALQLQPLPEVAIRAGDRVVVVGDRENVDRMAELAAQAFPAIRS